MKDLENNNGRSFVVIVQLVSIISLFHGILCFLEITYKDGKKILMKGSADDIGEIIKEVKKNQEKVDVLVDKKINTGKLFLFVGEIYCAYSVVVWNR